MHFEAILTRIARVLKAASVDYMVIGGQAVLIHGEPRLTKDIDVTLALPPFEPEPVLDILRKLSLEALVKDPSAFLKQTFVLPAIDPETKIRIDLVCSLSEYEREETSRTQGSSS